jgi:hypothetical protein
MNQVSYTGEDTVIFNDRVLTGLADGDCVVVTYPNPLMNVKIGKNGNAIYGKNETGKLAEVKYRILRGCSDDKYFNGLLAQQNQPSDAGGVLNTGELVKNIGNGAGAVAGDTTILSGGVFVKQPDVKSNVEGDPGQAVVEYTLQFSAAPRAIT